MAGAQSSILDSPIDYYLLSPTRVITGSGRMERYALAWIAALCTASYFCQICEALFVRLPRHSFSSLAPIHSANARQRQPMQHIMMISSGFSFSDGELMLVSLQKPLGILLEQEPQGPIIVTEVNGGGSAGSAGVKVGDALLAVQNASVESADLEEVLAFIRNAPRVINLRFSRKE